MVLPRSCDTISKARRPGLWGVCSVMEVVKIVVLVTYFTLLTILSIYGAHRLWMLLL